MEVLETYRSEQIDFKDHLLKVGDIINLEGPMLSLFQDSRNKELYLFDWADSNENTNRWLIYKAKADILFQFLARKITYKKMFDLLNEGTFYFADIAYSENIDYVIKRLKVLPNKYIPTKETFFDSEDSVDLDKIVTALSDNTKNNLNYVFFNPREKFLPNLVVHLSREEIRDTNKSKRSNNKFITLHHPYTALENQQYVANDNKILEGEKVGLYY